MRILMLAACPLPWPRGTPIRIHRMAEALVERGHEVQVATYPLGHAGTSVSYRIHRVARPNGRATALPGPSLRKFLVLDPLVARKAARLIGKYAFDVVHAHHYEGLIAALCARGKKTRLPIIYDSHTLLASELPYYRMPMPTRAAAAIGNWLDRALPRRADHVIAVTERMREWLSTAGGVGRDEVSLIPNGVEHDHFGVASPGHPSVGGWAGDGEGPMVVFSGNLAEYQGVDLLLQSFARLRSAFPRARLELVTDSDPSELLRQAAGRGLADAVSSVDADYASLPAKLAEAQVLVNPRPHCEGVPQKLLNYMAAGRPIVTFAGSAALLKHERTGLLVADGDVHGFADAIARVLRDPDLGQRLGRAARETVVAGHGWSQVAENVEAVYGRFAPGRPGYLP